MDQANKVTLREVLGKELERDRSILGAKVDGNVVDVHTPFVRTADTKIEPIHASSPEGLRILRHSAAHVMADAVAPEGASRPSTTRILKVFRAD